MFLTDKQITDLTGYRNRKRQRDWLDKNGVKYLAGAVNVNRTSLRDKITITIPRKNENVIF
jgi:hypothetical protein